MPYKLTPLDQTQYTMKIVKDLGMKKPTENYYKKVRMATFECINCNTHFDAVACNKAKTQKYCKSCNTTDAKKDLRDSRLYRIWATTKNKVLATNNHRHTYLDRGITLCQDWQSFDNFATWALTNGYSDILTIDRINNNGNYEPSNCRWVNRHVQAVNKQVLSKVNTSGYKGIHQLSDTRFAATIGYEHKRYNLGVFPTALQAAKAYDSFVLIMSWPHSINNVLADNELQFPINKNTLKFLNKTKGIHESDLVSKEL